MKNTNNNVALSVIVPFFNPGIGLDRCLQSIQNQCFDSFEVILVNDGSSDDSDEIAQKFQSSDMRFRYFIQENMGVSAARNLGIRKAKGELITFIDADDYLDEKYFSHLIHGSKDSDIVISGYSEVKDQVIHEFFLSEKKIFSNSEIIEMMINNESVKGYPWNKLYKRKILKDHRIFFDEEIHFGEDLLFSISYAQYCKVCQIVSEAGYFYVQSTGSISDRIFNINNLRRRMTYTTAGLKILMILESYPDVNSFGVKERLGRDGAYCFYQATKIKIPAKEIKDYLKKIQPFISWRLKISKKSIHWLKQMISIYRYIILGKINLIIHH